MRYLLLLSLMALTGCFQAHGDDGEDLHIVPVTNNPHILPQSGGGFPGMGGGAH